LPEVTIMLLRVAVNHAARGFASVSKVGVMGLGLMGHGVAQVSAQKGFEVVAVEQTEEFCAHGKSLIDKSLAKVQGRKVKKGVLTQEEADAETSEILGRLTFSTELEAFADCDLIIEAIVENYDVKLPIYAQLGEICKAETILASNTSSLSITRLGEASGRPDRMSGVHFFNPVQIMKLVEVIKTDETSDETDAAVKDYVKRIGKVGISCKDTPGFVVNRLLVPFIGQAVEMAERGDASVQDIDTAMVLGTGHPMGPLHLSDYVGNDTILSCLSGWERDFPDEPLFKAPPMLREMVERGDLGRKSGKGFYSWDSPSATKPSGPA